MFKIISIGILMYILYRLVFQGNGLQAPQRDNLSDQEEHETIDTDYEELD